MNTHPFFFLDSNSPHFATDSRYGQMFDIIPLTFDRVHSGHIGSSAFPLFKMPVELFDHVTRYLSKRDLETLALVDRDCCRLAALSKYKALQVELNSTKLYPELQASLQVSPSRLADCVRQLNVTPPQLVPSTAFPNLGTDMQYVISPPNTCEKTITRFFPNVHILNWDGPSFTSFNILDCIRTTSIKHLRIRGTLVDSSSIATCPTKGTTSFPLETLSLDIDWPSSNGSKENAFIEDLIHTVAPHLRQLVWKGRRTHYNAEFCNNIPTFRNLRSLVLDSVPFDTEHAFSLFFGDNTRISSLSVDASSAGTRNFLRTCGRVSSLRHFSSIYRLWTHSRYRDILTFLFSNDQLETVHIAHPIHHAEMDRLLFPMLHQHFDVLTSLRLTFDDTDIPQQSLQAISSISTLRRLWLSAGEQGFRSTWVIRHDDIFKYLKSLVDIEILAFSQDTYVTNTHTLAPRVDYYTTKALPVDLDITAYLTSLEIPLHEGRNVDYETGILQQAQMREQAWERWHAECMLNLTKTYSQAFPALRWCFMGQLAFCGDRHTPFATVDKQARREACLTSLRKVMSIDIWRPV